MAKYYDFEKTILQDLQKKKQEMLAKERKRREELQKKEYEKRHKDLQEKQKVCHTVKWLIL